MKRLVFIIVLTSTFAWIGCKPSVTGNLGDGWDKVKGLKGNWEIYSFYQKDLNSPVLEERNFTNMYVKDGFTPLQITFNDTPREYNTSIEIGKNYFGTNGSWWYDDDLYPSFLYLESGIDTFSFDLGRMVREIDQQMELEIKGGCRDSLGNITTETVVYRFLFDRK